MADRTTENSRAHYLLELFIVSREEMNLEDVTIANYRREIGKFLAATGISDPVDLRDDHLLLWLAEMRKGGLAPSSRAHSQRTVWAWISWMLKTRRIPTDPRFGVEMVRIPEKPQPSVSTDDFVRLLTVASEPVRSRRGNEAWPGLRRRNVALLHVLWSTGIRRNEIHLVDLEDVDLGQRLIRVRFGKGKRQRVVPFDSGTRKALMEYIAEDRKWEPGPLFVSARGQRLTVNAIRLTLERLYKRAGVHAPAHAFRRGFAARTRTVGMDMGEVANLLGHRTLVMVQKYSQDGESAAAIAGYRQLIG